MTLKKWKMEVDEQLKVFKSMIVAILLISGMFMNVMPKKAAAAQGNEYPIILVHGLAGWGRDEAVGIKYWGGVKDLEAYLNNLGHKTYTATVGPVSSNYDRAVELYYNIKGGKVDYGAAHSAEHKHNRYGKTYKGLYPEWDENNPVHLVGHSMGGLTIRGLTDLLKEGSKQEQNYVASHPATDISPLFTGDHNWIQSNTSIGTPHNGSQFADDESKASALIKEIVLNVAKIAGVNPNSFVYDFKLDQWGLKRQTGETFTTYLNRVMNSSIWSSKDISLTDLSTPGASDNNKWMNTFSDVYYFSYTAQTTYQNLLTKHHLPSILTNPIMLYSSNFMGSFTRQDSVLGPIIDPTWWANDGLVSVVSAKHPTNHPSTSYTNDRSPQPGIWNEYPVMNNWDHMDYMGLDALSYGTSFNIQPFYKNLAETLHKLPSR
ncbi:MAG: esterase/lipase family protein [Bacillaceae bacterium]